MEITKLTCICPKCWRMTPIELAMSGQAMHTKISYNRYNIHFDENVARGMLKFDPICKYCGRQDEYEDRPFIVDSMLGSAIKRFNQHGLKTNYSCQGHIVIDNDSNVNASIPYLMFEAGMDTIHTLHDTLDKVYNAGYYLGLVKEEIGIQAYEKGSYKRIYYTYKQACRLSKVRRERLEYCFSLSDATVDKFFNNDHIDKNQFIRAQHQFVEFLKIICDYLPEKVTKRKAGKQNEYTGKKTEN